MGNLSSFSPACCREVSKRPVSGVSAIHSPSTASPRKQDRTSERFYPPQSPKGLNAAGGRHSSHSRSNGRCRDSGIEQGMKPALAEKPSEKGERAAPGPCMKKRETRAASRQVIRDLSRSFPEMDGDEVIGLAAYPRSIFKSHDDFANPEQTIIVIDWDDTLFPTTWLTEDLGVDIGDPLPDSPQITRSFANCMKRSGDFLRSACANARYVSIVTLAKSPWVQNCLSCFAPELDRTIRELGIRICYARPDDSVQSHYDKQEFMSNEEKISYWTGVKAAAIGGECKRCYSQYPGQSWKNVLSFGDSDFERQGTRDVVKRWCMENAHRAYQMPRAKTVKFFDDPTCDEVADQLKLLTGWMMDLVNQDRGFNIDFDEADGEGLEGLERLVSGAGNPTDEDSPANALVEGRVWKLKAGGDPLEPQDWLLRRMWLSGKGQIWYESLQEAQAAQYIPGVCASQLTVSSAEADEVGALDGDKSRAVFPIRVLVPAGENPYTTSRKLGRLSPGSDTPFLTGMWQTAQVRTTYLAVDSEEQRGQWISGLQSFAVDRSPPSGRR